MKKEQEIAQHSEAKWFIEVCILTFILSMIFSYISANGVSNLGIIPAILILVVVILIGICFDIIGVAVTVANEHEFHAKASKKIEGSKNSLRLIKNSPKVANICADVIGDICRSIKWSNKCFNLLENITAIWNLFAICFKRNCCSINSRGEGFREKYCKQKLN